MVPYSVGAVVQKWSYGDSYVSFVKVLSHSHSDER